MLQYAVQCRMKSPFIGAETNHRHVSPLFPADMLPVRRACLSKVDRRPLLLFRTGICQSFYFHGKRLKECGSGDCRAVYSICEESALAERLL
jgi:hypothetical protein